MGFTSFHVPFLGFLVAFFFIQGLEAVSCPKNWLLFEQHCYGFFQDKLSWNDAETRMRWLDASVIDYIPWAPFQPSNCKDKQNCVELYANDYKAWNDQFCDIKQPYLCKMPMY